MSLASSQSAKQVKGATLTMSSRFGMRKPCVQPLGKSPRNAASMLGWPQRSATGFGMCGTARASAAAALRAAAATSVARAPGLRAAPRILVSGGSALSPGCLGRGSRMATVLLPVLGGVLVVAPVAAVRLRGCWCGWLPCGLLLLWLLCAYTAATKASPWQGSLGGQSQRSLRPCSFLSCPRSCGCSSNQLVYLRTHPAG